MSLCHWEDWAFAAPPAHAKRLIGPVGPTVWSWLRNRHPVVAERILDALNHMDGSAAVAAHHLSGVERFEVPSWEALSHGVRSPLHDPEDREPGGFQHGWQHEAASRVEGHFRDRNLMPRLAEHEMALLRSQSGP